MSTELLRFQKADHTYWVGDRQIRGVSKILEASGLKPPFYGRSKNDALTLGSEVHALTEDLDWGQEDTKVYDPRVQAYAAGWKKFRALHPFEILEIEKPRYSEEHDFCGTPDRGVMFQVPKHKGRGIVEVKTGERYDWHRFQTAAYLGLFGGEHRLIVYLSPDYPLGFEAEWHTDTTDWQKFAAALITTQGMKFERSTT